MDKETKTQMVEIGYCTKPHGLKGRFHLFLHNSESKTLKRGKKVRLITSDNQEKEFTIRSLSLGMSGDRKGIISFQEVEDRNSTLELLPFSIKVRREDLPKVDEEEFYLSDLIGFSVLEFGTGARVGSISKQYSNGSQEVFVVEGTEGNQDIDVPFVSNFLGKLIGKKK